MGRVIMNGPPECPGGYDWCVICLCEAKQKQWHLTQDEQAAGLAASGEKTTAIAWPAALTKELNQGTYRAVAGSAPQLGVIDGICWDHVAGLQPMHQTSLVDGQGLPAGLIKGK